VKAGVPVVFAGDYNVVPAVQDIYPTRSLDNNALIQPQSRKAYARLLAQGWTDALRRLQPEGLTGQRVTCSQHRIQIHRRIR
jgi:exodeoxyribonuclease-3